MGTLTRGRVPGPVAQLPQHPRVVSPPRAPRPQLHPLDHKQSANKPERNLWPHNNNFNEEHTNQGVDLMFSVLQLVLQRVDLGLEARLLLDRFGADVLQLNTTKQRNTIMSMEPQHTRQSKAAKMYLVHEVSELNLHNCEFRRLCNRW